MLPEFYQLKQGSVKDRALLLKFMQLTYSELFPSRQNFSHLAETVENYFSVDTPLWWVVQDDEHIACIWMGTAIDQVKGDRMTHIFLLYVNPKHRGRGIGTTLINQAQKWASSKGEPQIGLMVFVSNQKAIDLYHRLGYQPQAVLMIKSL